MLRWYGIRINLERKGATKLTLREAELGMGHHANHFRGLSTSISLIVFATVMVEWSLKISLRIWTASNLYKALLLPEVPKGTLCHVPSLHKSPAIDNRICSALWQSKGFESPKQKSSILSKHSDLRSALKDMCCRGPSSESPFINAHWLLSPKQPIFSKLWVSYQATQASWAKIITGIFCNPRIACAPRSTLNIEHVGFPRCGEDMRVWG
jgi:hypothetical protein